MADNSAVEVYVIQVALPIHCHLRVVHTHSDGITHLLVLFLCDLHTCLPTAWTFE